MLLVARRVLDAFLPSRIAGRRRELRPAIAERVDEIAAARGGRRVRGAARGGAQPPRRAGADARDAVLRQRAVLGLLGGCWLDVLSQPATQPSVIVNRLFAQHFTLRGEGNPRRSLHYQRRQRLEQAGVFLPEIAAADFLRRGRGPAADRAARLLLPGAVPAARQLPARAGRRALRRARARRR